MKTSLLIIGRNAPSRATAFNALMTELLKTKARSTIWVDPISNFKRLLTLYRIRNKFVVDRLAVLLKYLLVMFSPAYRNFLKYQEATDVDVGVRVLKTWISGHYKNRQLVILAHSAGARVATLIADDLQVKGIVCFGYPFKNPEEPDDPLRYRHLPALKTPTLILQGRDDEYGGPEVVGKYQFHKNTSVVIINTGHNFDVARAEIPQLTRTINHWIDNLAVSA